MKRKSFADINVERGDGADTSTTEATTLSTTTRTGALNKLTTLANRLLPIVAETHQNQQQHQQHKRNLILANADISMEDIETGNSDAHASSSVDADVASDETLHMLEKEARALMCTMNRVYEDTIDSTASSSSAVAAAASSSSYGNQYGEEDAYYFEDDDDDDEIRSEMHRLTSVVDSLTLEMAEVDAGLGGDGYEEDDTILIRKDDLRSIRLQLQPRAITTALYWSVAMLWAFLLLTGNRDRFGLKEDSAIDFLERTLGLEHISSAPP